MFLWFKVNLFILNVKDFTLLFPVQLYCTLITAKKMFRRVFQNAAVELLSLRLLSSHDGIVRRSYYDLIKGYFGWERIDNKSLCLIKENWWFKTFNIFPTAGVLYFMNDYLFIEIEIKSLFIWLSLVEKDSKKWKQDRGAVWNFDSHLSLP